MTIRQAITTYAETDTETVVTPQSRPRPSIKGMYFLTLIAQAIQSEIKSRTHKIANRVSAVHVAAHQPEISKIGSLDIYVTRDSHNLRRGGSLPWQYTQGLCDDQITQKQKREHLGQMLAHLPSNTSYIFYGAPDLRDREVIRDAFARAGFSVTRRSTLLHHGTKGVDPVDAMNPSMRTKIHKARRELELTDIGVDSFFDNFDRNLNGKISYTSSKVDSDMMNIAQEPQNKHIEVIAVRRKLKENASDDATATPVEAAAIMTTGADGYCRLIRITFRRAAENDQSENANTPAPHPHAFKMVLAEAMKRATERGLPLDVDGYTSGGGTLYARTGVFKESSYDFYTRLTPAAALDTLAKRVKQLIL